MIDRSKRHEKDRWSKTFLACRSAVRSEVGASTAEFLLPLLVLHSLCFGTPSDQTAVMNEIRDALSFDHEDCPSFMAMVERQKAVRTIITVLTTLQNWRLQEIEQNNAKRLRSNVSGPEVPLGTTILDGGDVWPMDPSAMSIEDTMKLIPLSLRARAAFRVGMFAQALQFAEMHAREQSSPYIFGGTNSLSETKEHERHRAAGILCGEEKTLVKDILTELKDYDTMSSLADDLIGTNSLDRIRDSLRLKEALGDWEGALQDFVRASQLSPSNQAKGDFLRGSLRCMLELGQYERYDIMTFG
jgi:tetratricopeptide (TPR) repeat protein